MIEEGKYLRKKENIHCHIMRNRYISTVNQSVMTTKNHCTEYITFVVLFHFSSSSIVDFNVKVKIRGKHLSFLIFTFD